MPRERVTTIPFKGVGLEMSAKPKRTCIVGKTTMVR
jgi:hypothetical protein